jgi:chorismate mutase
VNLHALRGANTVESNDREAILAATDALVREILERNALAPERVVSVIFTLTPDLDAEFPAVAARRLGFDQVPLLCAQEIDVPGSMPRVVRTLMHYVAPEGHEARHVYLGDAQKLRQDLQAAQ